MKLFPSPRILTTHLHYDKLPQSIFKNKAKVSEFETHKEIYFHVYESFACMYVCISCVCWFKTFMYSYRPSFYLSGGLFAYFVSTLLFGSVRDQTQSPPRAKQEPYHWATYSSPIVTGFWCDEFAYNDGIWVWETHDVVFCRFFL